MEDIQAPLKHIFEVSLENVGKLVDRKQHFERVTIFRTCISMNTSAFWREDA